jgi:hypothetical protein
VSESTDCPGIDKLTSLVLSLNFGVIVKIRYNLKLGAIEKTGYDLNKLDIFLKIEYDDFESWV